jgi:archaellin
MLVADQVTACAGSTDIDISPVTVTCGNIEPKFTILSYKNVTGVPIITENKITFTPANNNYAPAEIVYKVACGLLSASGKVIVVYKNNCTDVTCSDNKVCNKCTGNCEEVVIDLAATRPSLDTEVNTSGFDI